jgi:tRNA threonylcarbamoyladenosine modification (KEOPS) complex  Pcc1 subunit
MIIVAIEAGDLASLHAAAGSQLRALKVVTGVQRFAEE